MSYIPLKFRFSLTRNRSRIMGIFCNLLFTPLTHPGTEGEIPEETLPCMGPLTREKLYHLLLHLSEDESVNNTIVGLLSELVPQGTAVGTPTYSGFY